jgi:hypothetical protein
VVSIAATKLKHEDMQLDNMNNISDGDRVS